MSSDACVVQREVSGTATVYLGQDRDIWRPLIHTTVNLSEISSIKSTFQLRTFDPEGVIFYGDTKNGEDWFVLSLKDGVPLMQIRKEDMLVSAAGGPKLNDGKWHTLEVSNQGKFVILEVDGANGLVVGMRSEQTEEEIAGELRLALGGIMINKEKMIVQFEPQMDGCVREGSWLNMSVPWETEAEELWPCFQNIQPGSYFPGSGFAVFNTSGFPIDSNNEVKIELWADFTELDGTVLSIKAPGQELMLSVVANNNTKEVTIFSGKEVIIEKNIKSLVITLQTGFLQVISRSTDLRLNKVQNPGYWTAWKESHVAIGGLLGDGGDGVGSQFLKGCVKKIQVQGKDLDLDLAVKHMSISSHSCPA